jgi:hypothetical protein
MIISPLLALATKYISKALYKTEANWITPMEQIQWEEIRLVVLLNHTSLFEPVFVSVIPNKNLWRAANRLVVPIADVTMNRPVVGKIFRVLAPQAIAITRKRDDSWNEFMSKIADNALILIFPEGRMKRKGGLDKFGKPMNVKGGIADILEKMDHGKMIIAYSGGLHHVQAPGHRTFHVFKTIRVGVEQFDINEYKKRFKGQNLREAVIRDLEERMKIHCTEPD